LRGGESQGTLMRRSTSLALAPQSKYQSGGHAQQGKGCRLGDTGELLILADLKRTANWQREVPLIGPRYVARSEYNAGRRRVAERCGEAVVEPGHNERDEVNLSMTGHGGDHCLVHRQRTLKLTYGVRVRENRRIAAGRAVEIEVGVLEKMEIQRCPTEIGNLYLLGHVRGPASGQTTV
jgi:hypothetical protein